MTRRNDEFAASLTATEQRLQEIERHLDTMKTVLMVREPSSTVAAEAYDGLRKQIAAAMSERVAHLSQLVQLAELLAAEVDVSTLKGLVDSWSSSAGLRRVDDPSEPDMAECFELVEDLGGPLECVAPAYVDTVTGRVMRSGKSRRGQRSAASEPVSPEVPQPGTATVGEQQ